MNRIYHNVHQQARYCVSVTQVQHHNYHTQIRSMCRKVMLHRRSNTDTDTNTNTEPKYVEHTGTHKHKHTNIHAFDSLFFIINFLKQESHGIINRPRNSYFIQPLIHETQVIIAHYYNLLIFFSESKCVLLIQQKNGSF